jgi:hypothetical protein
VSNSSVSFITLLDEFRVKHGAAIVTHNAPFTPPAVLAVASGAFCVGFRAALAMLISLPDDQAEHAGEVIVSTLRECEGVLEELTAVSTAACEVRNVRPAVSYTTGRTRSDRSH